MKKFWKIALFCFYFWGALFAIRFVYELELQYGIPIFFFAANFFFGFYSVDIWKWLTNELTKE